MQEPANDLEPEYEDDTEAPEAQAEQTQPDASRQQTGFLTRYFHEMSALDVLAPEEEFTAARTIEALEIELWTTVLGQPALLAHHVEAIAAQMDDAPPELDTLSELAEKVAAAESGAVPEGYAETVHAAAQALHAADKDRLCLDALIADLGEMEPRRGRKLPLPLRSRAFRSYLKRVRAGEARAREARNDFVRANLRLVVSIARRFNHGRMALADLIQEGNLGLIKAVERYDYRRGFRFSTYASWWIRHAISRALADKGREVRLPVHMQDAQLRLAKAQRELSTELGRQPSSDELSAATSIPKAKIEKMRLYLLDQSVSLDRPVNDEDGMSYAELLHDPDLEGTSPSELLTLHTITVEVRRTMEELKPIEADILRQRFGLDNDEELTLKQIGERYNLSRERIRQLQEQALTKMRRSLERKRLL
ncbi:sigma-70 family RNA polymerase sigma factor [Haliangium sp.]|uniref:sigma-70 family RNA polymerase sigma factor n=1 Tax=Haliangium sp. TaxID=2663208 RepID=UPI003D0FC348